MKKSSNNRKSNNESKSYSSSTGKEGFVGQMKKYVNDDAVRNQIDYVIREKGKK